jgi:ABC-type sugar transport system permease subunit
MVGLINYGNNAYGDYANKNEYFWEIVLPQIIKMVTFIAFNAVLFTPSLINLTKHSKAK